MTKPQLASGPAGAGQRPGVDYPALKNGLDYVVDWWTRSSPARGNCPAHGR